MAGLVGIRDLDDTARFYNCPPRSMLSCVPPKEAECSRTTEATKMLPNALGRRRCDALRSVHVRLLKAKPTFEFKKRNENYTM